MSSSNEQEDSNDSKSNFIGKLLDEMKSEFNKQSKIDKNEEEDYDTLIPAQDLTPEKLKTDTDDVKDVHSELETSKVSAPEDSVEVKNQVKQNSSKGIKSVAKIKLNTDSESPIKEENSLDAANIESDTKPRIVLTLRTEKTKSTVPNNSDKDNSEESSSPGRRSLRIKTHSSEEKEKKTEMESGLKRSARRRSKDCMESILQSAIARKEKSYNETSRPQRLTRKLKPTAKILANLEMCQKSQALKYDKTKSNDKKVKSPGTERQRFSYDKLEKGSEQAIIESDLDYSKHDDSQKMPEHKKFKRKHKHKSVKPPSKKIKKETDSDSSSFSSHDNEDKDEKSPKSETSKSPRKSSSDTDSIKPFRRSHRKIAKSANGEDNTDICEPLSGSVAEEENITPADPESSSVICESSIKKCLCTQSSQIYISTFNSTDITYCTAVDSVNNKIIGCNNIVSNNIPMLRPSTRIPYIILCDVHKQRLLRHNCCPTCGLFCTQGKFVQCSNNHQYHRDCQIVIGEQIFCPHCGTQSPKYDIEISMKCLKKPVFLPVQKLHYPSAKMSFQGQKPETQEKRSVSPPLIPVNDLELIKSVDLTQTEEKFNLQYLIEVVKLNDVEKVATILGNVDFDINEVLPENQEGMTILHYASQEGLLSIVHMLLVAGAEQDVFDKEQNTPLTLAIQSFKNNVVKYLIKSGASINLKGTDGMSALHLAAKFGNLEACQYLLSSSQNRRSYINSIDDGGWTPLVWACEHGHFEVTRFLLQSDADPFLRDVEQNVALHWAAFSGSSQITEILLNSGCEVNCVNAHGDSPLHVAARQDKYNCVLMLLARGANVHLINKSEEKPLDCCVSNPGDCYTAISLNVHLQSITSNPNRRSTILTNDISRGKEINPVQCINTIDDEPKPTDFVYVTENCITSDINIDRKITTLQSCNCEDRCTSSECLCSNNSLKCWYTDEGKLSANFNYADPPMLFECNPMCSCNAITCNNRVVQHGLTQRFQLFRTEGKGWGIKTLRMIPRGSYVCEYVGEIISDLEADQREDDSYLFDLDNRDGETFCIDARRYGNLSRFINHSCHPNLLPVRIYIEHQDLRFPRIAFFANRDIQANEELGFDYGEKFWIIKYKSFTCTCGYEICRYSETTIKMTLENYQRRLLEEQEPIQHLN